MKSEIILSILLICCPLFLLAQQTFSVESPDGNIMVTIELNDKITYSVAHQADQVIAPSTISMTLIGGDQLGVNPRLRNKKTNTVDQTIEAPFYKRSQITDHYNELILNFRGNYSVTFRAYNDGTAYRFATSMRDSIQVENEEAPFNFAKDFQAIVPYVRVENLASFEPQFWNSFENTYTHTTISKLESSRLMFLPLVVEVDNGKKVCITEADLEDYPGMYLNHKSGQTGLAAVYPAYPKEEEQGGHNNLQMIVTEREDYIARTKGSRSFPWRVMVISTEDRQLADSDMVYKLASPSRVADISWIKPGKVAWDWWNDWNLFGVDFETGVNNETYKYYIDFAAEHGIGYVILDEGWSVNGEADLMQVVPEIDLPELTSYAKQKGVDIVLWVGYHAFERDMANVCKHYADMGVKGFKVDFMDRDDQEVMNFFYKAAELAAENHLFLDFHGAFKPAGLQRTYPNVLNFEGVHGLEQMKWSPPSVDQVTYDVTIPFIRMLAGPMDYTQGAMRNATRQNYHPVNSEPMSQGTRCRQLAEYVIFESPFNMLCDDPTAYMEEPECTKFIASVPTIWDETHALDGKIAEYVAIARQKGDDWYVGALTNWDAREMTLDLSFLGDGNYQAEIFKDGINADRIARDFQQETIRLPTNKQLKISMAPGGGFVARIYEVEH